MFMPLLLLVLWSDVSVSFVHQRSTTLRQRGTILEQCSSLSSANLEERTDGHSIGVTIVDGPFHPSLLEGYWGQRPILIRNAFDKEAHKAVWPTWNDMMQLAQWSPANSDDELHIEPGESARLIRHVPDKLESFNVEFGPFEPKYLLDTMSRTKKQKWSLVVNDVDRYLHTNTPSLASWMDATFGFLPRWRRDDAQVSLACTGGGIGPHVDNYDVFLIQSSGQRQWLVGTDTVLSAAHERDQLIPDISVSILRLDESTNGYTELQLEAGDMLYLPPRFVHWGTATSDDCMTLSVGCRAPGAADLVAQMAEVIQTSVRPKAVQRYTDHAMLSSDDGMGPSLSQDTKQAMKVLVREAMEDLLSDDKAFDELVGTLTTKAMRYSDAMAQSYSEAIGPYREMWGDTPNDLLQRVMELGDQCTLRRTPGISIATSRVATELGTVDRIYFDGNMFETVNDDNAMEVFRRVERGEDLNGNILEEASESVLQIFEELISEGFIQAHRNDQP